MSDTNNDIPPWMQGWTSHEDQEKRYSAVKEEGAAERAISTRTPSSLGEVEAAKRAARYGPTDGRSSRQYETARLVARHDQATSERNENDIRRYDRIAGYARRLADEWRESDREDLLHETHLEDKIEHCSRILARITARSIDRSEGKYPDYGTLLQIDDRPELWGDRIADELEKRELERRRRGGSLLG